MKSYWPEYSCTALLGMGLSIFAVLAFRADLSCLYANQKVFLTATSHNWWKFDPSPAKAPDLDTSYIGDYTPSVSLFEDISGPGTAITDYIRG